MTTATLTLNEVKALATGSRLRSVELRPTTMTQLVFYCAATRVTDPIHFDREFARGQGFADVIVNGSLRIAWLTQALADLVGAPDFVSALHCAHRGPLHVGEPLHIEVFTSGLAVAVEEGWQLPCALVGRSSGKIIDQGEGALTFVNRSNQPGSN